MIALSVASAKNIAIGAAGVFVVFSLLSAWIIKNIVGKVIMIVLTVGLALGAWTQRGNLQDCANNAEVAAQKAAAAGKSDGLTQIPCKLMGFTVKL
jgi:hypothetical protein